MEFLRIPLSCAVTCTVSRIRLMLFERIAYEVGTAVPSAPLQVRMAWCHWHPLDAKCVPYLKRRGWWHSSTGSSIKASPVQPTAGRPASCFMATLKRRLPDGIPCWQLEKKTFNKLMIFSSSRNLKSILARFTVRLTLRLRAWVYHRRYRRPFQRLYKPHL